MAIDVHELSKAYGKAVALHDVTFSAARGRIVGFLGPNGAGKSTTMKILSGSLAADAGKATICGVDVFHDSLAARRHVGYLPEHNPLYVDLYIHEALRFMAGVHGIRPAHGRISEVIELTGLGEAQHKKIRHLSKGYRQRVGLAQAILHDPEVLILDEPTSGLDPNQLQEIRALIRRLGRKKTVLLSTHIMQEVTAVCDDVVLIHRGRVAAAFPLAELPVRYADDDLESLFTRLTTNH